MRDGRAAIEAGFRSRGRAEGSNPDYPEEVALWLPSRCPPDRPQLGPAGGQRATGVVIGGGLPNGGRFHSGPARRKMPAGYQAVGLRAEPTRNRRGLWVTGVIIGGGPPRGGWSHSGPHPEEVPPSRSRPGRGAAPVRGASRSGLGLPRRFPRLWRSRSLGRGLSPRSRTSPVPGSSRGCPLPRGRGWVAPVPAVAAHEGQR